MRCYKISGIGYDHWNGNVNHINVVIYNKEEINANFSLIENQGSHSVVWF